MKMNEFDCRVSFNARMKKEDYDLFKDKCKALGIYKSEIIRHLIKEFNDNYWLVVE